MTDRIRYALFRIRGWLAFQLVRPFPLPLYRSPRSLFYRLSARLWGIAYTDGAVTDFAEWREFIRKAPDHAR